MTGVTVFTYYKEGKIKVLNIIDATKEHNILVEEGWEHTATLDAAAWIEYLFNDYLFIDVDAKNLNVEFLQTLTSKTK